MTTEIATVQTPSNSIALTNKAGKQVGTRFFFNGTQTAAQLRKSLREGDATMKGRKLDIAVNDLLRGNTTFAEQMAHAFITEQSARGIVWDVAESRNKVASIKGVLAPAATVEPAKIDVKAMTPAEREALFAELAAAME